MSAYWSEGARFASNGFSIDRLVVFSDVGDPIGVYYDGSFRRIVPVSK
jgi:hypothetical protein